MVRRSAELEALIADLRERIGTDEVSFEFTTSPGPGGQNVNKVATRAVLLFSVANSRSLGAIERVRVLTKLRSRINTEGVLRVSSSKHRSQQANRAAAEDRFFELLGSALVRPKVRKPTKVSRAARARRMDEKRRRGVRKTERRSGRRVTEH